MLILSRGRKVEEVYSQGRFGETFTMEILQRKEGCHGTGWRVDVQQLSGDTTQDSHSWGLEEMPVSENEVRADCGSPCH